jgi:hypothetical protein
MKFRPSGGWCFKTWKKSLKSLKTRLKPYMRTQHFRDFSGHMSNKKQKKSLKSLKSPKPYMSRLRLIVPLMRLAAAA